MDWRALLDPKIQDFMNQHHSNDVRKLALKKAPESHWPYPLIMDQIKARQKAEHKLPSMFSRSKRIIFPASSVIEQASSEACANYKASLVSGNGFIDLTSGAGIDSIAFSHAFKRGVLVEQETQTAEILAHNMALICEKPIEILAAKAEDFVTKLVETDFIYIDPQRRDAHTKGKYKLEDCTPNVLELIPALKGKAKHIMIKCSPMMDIDEGLEIMPATQQVYVVQYQRECKELLFLLAPDAEAINKKDIAIMAVDLNEDGTVRRSMTLTKAQESACKTEFGAPDQYLFEPDPAFLKSGAYKMIANIFGLKKLHPHTHLYTAPMPKPDFPGRQFQVIDVLPAKPKSIGIKQANIAIRNFPGTTEDLKKRFKIRDGGDVFLFACTMHNNQKALIKTQKYNL